VISLLSSDSNGPKSPSAHEQLVGDIIASTPISRQKIVERYSKGFKITIFSTGTVMGSGLLGYTRVKNR
jgi:hypothetical protein